MYDKLDRSHQLGSYPSVNIIVGNVLALLVIGLFGLFMLHVEKLTAMIKENVKMQVYLHRNITEEESIHLCQKLHRKDFVYRKNGHATLTFIPKEEAAQMFTQLTGEDFLQVLDENPLRDTYIVHIAPNYQTSKQLQTIQHEIEEIKGVFEVDHMADFSTSLIQNTTTFSTVLATFACILLMVVSVLIHNTIRLAVYTQRFLIRSMYLVGATAAFIRRPFLIRAVLMGCIAGIITNMLLVILLYNANQYVEGLTTLQAPTQISALLGLVLSLGVLISFFGTYGAVNKYLNSSLDDLY